MYCSELLLEFSVYLERSAVGALGVPGVCSEFLVACCPELFLGGLSARSTPCCYSAEQQHSAYLLERK